MADRLLVDILGPDGANAVERAVADRPDLAGAVRPRAALAWAGTAIRHGYQGLVPGRDDVHLLVKGETWAVDDLTGSGQMSLAALLVALNGGTAGSIPKGRLMMRLGKNLDLLTEATWRRTNPVQELRLKAKASKKLAKAGKDAPGPKSGPALPTPPIAPTPPTPPTKGVQAKPPQQPKAPAASLWRSEATTPCSTCGRPQAVGSDLTGCACWGDLLAKAEVLSTPLGFMVRFQPEDREDAAVFLEEVRCDR